MVDQNEATGDRAEGTNLKFGHMLLTNSEGLHERDILKSLGERAEDSRLKSLSNFCKRIAWANLKKVDQFICRTF